MDEKFDMWAIIELFGHARLAGRVTEANIGGCSFVRVDVPEIKGEQAPFTRFLGNGAIYSITPCSEELARLAAQRIHAAPVTIYMPEVRQLPGPQTDEGCEGEDVIDIPF